jgi:hypothetical protein
MDPDQIPLRDLHLPDVIGLWPFAPGWWVLILLAVAGVIYLLFRLLLRWRFNAARRLALRELASLRRDYEGGADATVLSKALSELMRRSMLAYAPRAEVARLTGDTWLSWLDRGLSDAPFSTGVGRMLESLPYQRPEVDQDNIDVSGLLDVVQLRLKTPLPEGTA